MLSKAPLWFVYIIQCSDGTLYTGSSPDITKRITTHNAGTGAKYTRSRLPVVLRYTEPSDDKLTALKRERAIKKLSRVKKLALIAGKQL